MLKTPVLLLAVLCSLAVAPWAVADSCKPLPSVTVQWESVDVVPGSGAAPVVVITALAPGRQVVLTVSGPGGFEDIVFRGEVDPAHPVRIPVAMGRGVRGELLADATVTGPSGVSFRVGARVPFGLDLPVRPAAKVPGATVWNAVPLTPPSQRAARSPQQMSATGTFQYRDREFNETGFVNAELADDPILPVRRARVALLRNDSVIAEADVDDNGAFSFSTEAVAGTYVVRVASETNPAAAPRIKVRANVNTVDPFFVHSAAIESDGLGDLDFGTSLIEAGAGGGAFNVLDNSLAGADLVTALSGTPPAPLCTVNWNASSNVGSFYTGATNSVFLLDEEGYDDTVIIHEYGHYVADQYNGTGWPGGPHFVDDSNQHPMLSFSEGFASYWQSASRLMNGSNTPSWYVDTNGEPGAQNLFFSFDCEGPSFGVKGTASEVVVQGALWDIIDGPDTPDPFPGDDDPLELSGITVWDAYTSTAFNNATTPTLEDLWDAWFSPEVDNGEDAGMVVIFGQLGAEYFADALEPDDTDGAATALPIDGTSVHHTFYAVDDVDHHSLTLDAGQAVTVETNNTIAHSDTRIRVRDALGATVVENDDRAPGDISSSVSFTAEVGGIYVVEVSKVAKGFSSLLEYGSYDVRAVLGETTPIPLLERAGTMGLADQNFSVGAAWADYDGDGDPDLFVASNPGSGVTAGRDVLYQNRISTFVNATASSGLGGVEGGVTPAWGDIDNDGDPDLFVTDHAFWRNDEGSFVDISANSGVTDMGREFDAEFADVDGDGFLDLFVSVRDGASALWINNGDGTFTESAAAYGLSFPEGGGEAHGCAWGDFDLDGDPDLFVVYRSTAGHGLFRNDGGTFTEVTTAAGVSTTDPAVGVLWADIDGDGLLDAYICSDAGNKFYRNQGDGTFEEAASRYGIDHGGTSRGAATTDYDLDGDLDLFVVQFNANNRLHQNLSGSMVLMPDAGNPGFGHASAWADYDLDGDSDLFVARQLEANLLFRSSATGTQNQWLQIALEGTESNRDGIGAVVRLYAEDTVFTRFRGTGTGWAGMSLIPELFGVPGGAVDSVTVDWPSGRKTVVLAPATNQVVAVSEDQTVPVRPEDGAGALLRVGAAFPNPFTGAAAVRFTLGEAVDVSFTVFDVRGRAVQAIDAGRMPAGDHVLGWDGTDAEGQPTAAGVYFFRLQAGEAAQVRKVVRID